MRLTPKLLCLSFTIAVLCGCEAKYYPVKGRVHYPDGSAVKAGRVYVTIEPGRTGGAGSIDEDGTFVMGSKTVDDGLPAGTYHVFIMNAQELPRVLTLPPEERRRLKAKGGPDEYPLPLIHERYTSPKTSGLVFEVPKQTEWDIVVDKPEPPN